MFLTCIREVLGSNQGRDTDYPEESCGILMWATEPCTSLPVIKYHSTAGRYTVSTES
jgi:hypothetical protein